MYKIHIDYGLDNDDKIFTTEKELRNAFRSRKNFDKYVNKIDNLTRQTAKQSKKQSHPFRHQ